MKIESYFPLCNIHDCPDRGQHRHVMPWQRDFIESKEKYVLVKGGVGSGKTLPAAILCHLLLMTVPGNRFFIGRRTRPKLHDPTMRVYLEVLERSGVGDSCRYLESRDGYPHRIVYPNGSEALFRDTTDLGKFLGPEYGGIYIDEAQEEPERTFTGLMERLRLPHAGPYLKFILTTNPPRATHWIATRFGDTGTKTLGESSYRVITTSTRENRHLPPNYMKDLFANHSEAEIRRIIDGEYGFSPEGPPVYPQFKNEAHIGLPRVMDPGPLIRAWDFGHRHPACTYHQMFRCRFQRPHWTILAELDAQGVTWEQFAVRVLDYTKLMFPTITASMIEDCGDAAGAAYNDRGPGPIIQLQKAPFRLRFRYKKTRDVDPGLNLVREHLRSSCKCGLPWLLIHRRCKNVIDGFAGGYHYPGDVPGHVPRKYVPVKDGYYDDVMDTVRYAADNFLRKEMIDPRVFAALVDPPSRPNAEADAAHWQWMESVR